MEFLYNIFIIVYINKEGTPCGVKVIIMHTVTVYITDEIKLVNEGYNNKIIDDSKNNIIEGFTDTLNNALTYATLKYDIN